MRKRDYPRFWGYACVQDVIRKEIGYGVLFSKFEVDSALNADSWGIRLSHLSLDDIMNCLVKYDFVQPVEKSGEMKYLLLRPNPKKVKKTN